VTVDKKMLVHAARRIPIRRSGHNDANLRLCLPFSESSWNDIRRDWIAW
jgi:hypothetical protein